MRMVVVMVALMFVTASGFAEEKPASKEAPKKPVAADVQKGGDQEPGKARKQPEWPRPYQPSEEISADSVVPFPADI